MYINQKSFLNMKQINKLLVILLALVTFSSCETYGDYEIEYKQLLPESLRQNKGHNVFYGLPLLLGLLGIYWQWARGKKGKQQFSVLFFLFFSSSDYFLNFLL